MGATTLAFWNVFTRPGRVRFNATDHRFEVVRADREMAVIIVDPAASERPRRVVDKMHLSLAASQPRAAHREG